MRVPRILVIISTIVVDYLLGSWKIVKLSMYRMTKVEWISNEGKGFRVRSYESECVITMATTGLKI